MPMTGLEVLIYGDGSDRSTNLSAANNLAIWSLWYLSCFFLFHICIFLLQFIHLMSRSRVFKLIFLPFR